MKKRIVCVLLTLIMLVSLVPTAAMNAAAASLSISESAITVLKQLEGYSKTCDGKYIGYGTLCPECAEDEDEGPHVMYEKAADTALRAELKTLDASVNAFATKNGLSLSQSKHDALVLFSFQNGTAWTNGTGEFQTAIKSGAVGTEFVDAICKWNSGDNDDRRMIETNMYLNGVYSSSVPSRYIRVEYNLGEAEGAVMAEDSVQYYDVATPVTITLKPTWDADHTFQGWYMINSDGQLVRVSSLSSKHDGVTLIALWQDDDVKPGSTENAIEYTISKSNLISTTVYNKPNGDKVTTYINENNKEVSIKLGSVLNVNDDYVDSNGVLWARIVDVVEDDEGNTTSYVMGWVKVKGGSASSSGSSSTTVDINVTVTNSYVNMRKNASITSTKNGSFSQGDVLRIIDVKNGSDGFLWGQVATSASDDTAIGWVALMYTDYNTVIANTNSSTSSSNSTVVATATITYQGYVNVRSDAGINNQIVGALSQGVTVNVYETKYVNGIQWGRTSTGWFCLTYANVTWLVENSSSISDAGFANYVFSASLNDYVKNDTRPSEHFYKAAAGDPVEPDWKKDSDGNYVLDDSGNKIEKVMTSNSITISNLVEVDGEDWGKTSYGWIKLSDVTLNVAKFYVIADTLTVRSEPDTASSRVDVLIKGTEFNVTEIDLVGETIWGHADKVGETDLTYDGWVNLSNANVSRNGAPTTSVGGSSSTEATTVKMARVVGTDNLRVRITGSTSGKQLGTLSYGTTAVVLEEKNGWYNLDIDVDNDPSTGSWVSGTYLELYTETIGGSSSSSSGNSGTTETGMGIVANTYTGVNIRSGAGTGNALVGKYLTGTSVEILEVKTVGSAKWGRTEKGWVCMDYIVMVDNYEIYNGTTGSAGGSTSTTTSSEVAIYTGHVTEETKIFKDTTTKAEDDGGSTPVSDVVRTLSENDPITLHEIIVQVEYETEVEDDPTNNGQITTVYKRTTYWARVNEGYIYAPGNCIVLDTLDEHVYTLAVDVEDITDVNTGEEFDLEKGETVVVTKLEIENSYVKGYIECDKGEGWVKMSNMTKGFASSTTKEDTTTNDTTSSSGSDASNSTTETTPSTVIGSTGNTGGSVGASGYKYTGKVINTNEVNVRATASTTASITTTLKRGASLVIYETVISEYMAWGRCDSGWVYLYYVDLTPVGNGAVDARVVYNDNTVIYSDMNGTEKTGSTYCKMAVVDIYEIVGKMARTELGWISTDNLL